MTTAPDIFRDSVYSILANVHTSLPGIIVSYDPSTNKAQVQPALNKNFTSGEMPMPILQNVPIVFPKNITFPINAGDYVLLIFSERSLDLWKSVGGQVTPTDPRKFDLSDAIAIPGLMPFTESYPDNNNQDYVINFGGSSITIKPDGAVTIKTSSTVAIGKTGSELLDLIEQLMTALRGPLVTGTALGGPLNPIFTNQVLLIENQINALKGVIP